MENLLWLCCAGFGYDDASMVKETITRQSHSAETITQICSRYGLSAPSSYKALSGGFSGTNYRLDFFDGTNVCLKICHGYLISFVEAQARVQDFLQKHHYKTACFAVPLISSAATDNFQFATLDPTTGDPAIVLTFSTGRAADALLEEGRVSVKTAFDGFGSSLGALHSIPVLPGDNLRTYEEGGACDVYKQMTKSVLHTMESSEFTKDHPFVTKFYKSRRDALETTMLKAKSSLLQIGVIHGDPFADNVMLDPITGQVVAWIDWEDATTGPLLFDVAVAIIGTCFPSGSSTIDFERLQCLMAGYTRVRPLSSDELAMLLDFCRLSLLCNCSWRFVNFHVEHREIVECRNRYKELEERIYFLELETTENMIMDIFQKVEKSDCYVVPPVKDDNNRLVSSRRLVLLGAAVFTVGFSVVGKLLMGTK